MTDMQQPSLQVAHLVKQYANADRPVLNDISFEVPHGKVFVIVGPSGSGKSTLLRTIAGLEPIQGGTISLNGEVIETGRPGTESAGRSKRSSELRTRVGMVFQSYDLFPNKTVLGNITLAPTLVQKRDKAEVEEEAVALLERVGLADRKDAWPHELSGGQRQRVAFARALAPNPQLLLLDEPFAAIDAKVRQELRTWLKEMISKLGVTSIFVTHDQDEAIEVADEIIITNRGRIEQVGTPIEIYRHPQTSFTATFFGHTSVLADYQKYHTFQHMDGVEKAIVRPEFLKITKKNEVQKYGSSASQGVVERTSFRGDWIELEVRVNDDLLIAKRDLEEESVSVGETVDVFLYRLFVIVGEKCYLLENQSLQDDSVFI